VRILVIADEVASTDCIYSFKTLWAWYVTETLSRLGAGICFAPPIRNPQVSDKAIIRHFRELSLDGVDHILALGHRYFEHIPRKVSSELKRRCRGLVTQTHESARRETLVDCTFTMTEVSAELSEHNVCVGWAADPELLWPAQNPQELRILIDHPEYHHDGTRPDRTQKILRECEEFMVSQRWREWGYESIDLARMPVAGAPFPEICADHRRRQLFMVTHRETCGFSAIESAMAGGLPIVPEGFIPPDRLATIRHVAYQPDDPIPWDDALDSVDPIASRFQAADQTWRSLVEKMMAVFCAHRHQAA
jgi:hypothetical protein